ncbi:guanylate kinase [Heliophilum fasciatum]|nr:guanylate kinase [Heliophilum fasciatum]
MLDSWLSRLGRGVLFVLSGPSGAGKGTLCRNLLQQQAGLQLSVSATTRQPRTGEQDGIHYHFLQHEDFVRQIEAQAFLEYAQVYDHYYGTPRTHVVEALQAGRDVLLEIDIQGALQVKASYPEAALIFVAPPSLEELSRRIYTRGTDSPEVIRKRLALASSELTYIDRYDYCVVNDDVEKATARLQAILHAEKCRIHRQSFRLLNEEECSP